MGVMQARLERPTRLAALAATLVFFLAALVACSGGSDKSATTDSAPSTSAGRSTSLPPATTANSTTAPASATTTAALQPIDLRVYFMRGAHLGVARRRVAGTVATARAAMNELLAGPNSGEATAGLSSTIPAGISLLGIDIADGTATVDLSGGFAGSASPQVMAGRFAQVVFTMTQFPTVSRVAFHLDGRAVAATGPNGAALDHPAARTDFEPTSPAILVEAPSPGDQVSSPIRVTGTANVFEATFLIELTDAAGKVVVQQTVMATSGSGTRGTFDVALRYAGHQPGPGKLTVFDASAKDGSRQDVVDIPVVLA